MAQIGSPSPQPSPRSCLTGRGRKFLLVVSRRAREKRAVPDAGLLPDRFGICQRACAELREQPAGQVRLDTTTGARAVPARSTSLGRGGLENSRVCTSDMPLRTGTVRGPAVAESRKQPAVLSSHSEVAISWNCFPPCSSNQPKCESDSFGAVGSRDCLGFRAKATAMTAVRSSQRRGNKKP